MSNDLAEVLLAVQTDLRDTGEAIWSDTEITEHIRHAMRVYSELNPQHLAKKVDCTATREYSIASAIAADVINITDLWYPYDSSEPAFPPERPTWEILGGGILYIHTDDLPSTAEDLRVFYTAPHTLDDLDSASATTLDVAGKQAVQLLAEAYAAQSYAASAINTVTVSGWTPRQLQAWADARLKLAEAEIARIIEREIRKQDTRTHWELED
jgi:hypothetical protein